MLSHTVMSHIPEDAESLVWDPPRPILGDGFSWLALIFILFF
jgi:hypothetical protein